MACKFWRSLVLLVAVLAPPSLACAHGSAKGLGAFWNGVLHPLVEPAQLLALVAAGLWMAWQTLSREVQLRCGLAGAVAFGLAAGVAHGSGSSLALADSGLPDRVLQALGLAMALATVAGWLVSDKDHRSWDWLVPAISGLTLGAVALGSPAGDLRSLNALGWMGGAALGSTLIVGYTVIGLRWTARRFTFGQLVPRVFASWVAASLLLVMVLPWIGVDAGLAAGRPPKTGNPTQR